MKLNRRTLRKMILNEIKMLNENVVPKADSEGRLVVGNYKYQLSKGLNLFLDLTYNDNNGSADVVLSKSLPFGVKKKMGEGHVDKATVDQIVKDGLKGKKFTIQTTDHVLDATPVRN